MGAGLLAGHGPRGSLHRAWQKGDVGHCAVPSAEMGIEWTPVPHYPVPETQAELSSASFSTDLPGPRE